MQNGRRRRRSIMNRTSLCVMAASIISVISGCGSNGVTSADSGTTFDHSGVFDSGGDNSSGDVTMAGDQKLSDTAGKRSWTLWGPPASDQQLNAIWGLAPGEMWAVGLNGTFIRWVGGRWRTEISAVTKGRYG